MTLLEMSAGGAALIAAVLLLRRLALYRLPKWTFLLLWAVALARLLLPVALPSPVSVYGGAERLWQAVQTEAPGLPAPGSAISNAPAPGPAVSAPSGSAANHGTPAAPAVEGGTSPASGPAVSAPAPSGPPVSGPEDEGGTAPADEPTSKAIPVYLTGAILPALLFALAYWRCCRMFRRASPVENEALSQWRQDHPKARIRFRQSGEITAPLTYGFFRPAILFPLEMDWTDEEGLRYILAHEYIHIRRRDVWWKLLLAAAVCVHWFNPLVWAMYVYANRDIELSCDEAVVRAFGLPARPDYAMSLLNAQAQRRRLLPLCSGYSGKSAMEERIVAIMKSRKLTAAAVLAALVLVCAMAAVFAGTPVEPMTNLTEQVSSAAARTLDSPYQKGSRLSSPSGMSVVAVRPYDETASYGLTDHGTLPDGTEYWVFYLTPAETVAHMTNRRGWHGKAYVPIGDTDAVGRALGDPLSVDGDTYIAVDVDGLPTTMATVDVGCFPAGGSVKIGSYSSVLFKPANPSDAVTVKVSTHEGKSVTAGFRVYTTRELPAAAQTEPPVPADTPVPAVSEPQAPAEPQTPPSKYPVNSLGHTYGRWTEADGYDDVPDLIWHQTYQDISGYLKREELYPYSYPVQTQEDIQRYMEWYHEITKDWTSNTLRHYGPELRLYTQEEEVLPKASLTSFVWDGCDVRTDEEMLAHLTQGTLPRIYFQCGSAPVEKKPWQGGYYCPDEALFCPHADISPWKQALIDEFVAEDGDWHRNSKGETYGPGELVYYVGYYPDLVMCRNNCLGEPDIKFYFVPYTEKGRKEPGSYPVYDAEHNLIGHEVITDGPPSRINRIFPLDMEI